MGDKKADDFPAPLSEAYGTTSKSTLLYPARKKSRPICKIFLGVLLALALIGGLIATIVYYNITPRPKDFQWWHKTTIYQIYPRSFKDSNGDGFGDLKGITSKLEHVKKMGFETIWLSPFYTSPMKDFGYDIADFKNVDPIFGNLDDFKEMMTKIKELKLRIVLDFVPNHSSDQHMWFKESRKNKNNDNPYRDYYVWHDGHPTKKENMSGEIVNAPPNNWISVFGGPSWQWDNVRRQYYLHQFLDSQPDLNWRNPNVVQEMDDTLKFWLGLGVDGFRIDAIPFLFEVPHDKMVDADECTPNTAWVGLNEKDYEYFLHPFSRSVDPLHTQVKSWSTLMEKYSEENKVDGKVVPKFLILEVVDKNVTEVNRYYPAKPFETGAMPFYMGFVYMNPNTTGFEVDKMVHANLDVLPQGAWPNWVIGNHDQRRATTKLGNPVFIDGLNMLNLLLPGIPTTYYGEEIGMLDTLIQNYTDVKDPAALHPDFRENDVWRIKTRDYSRSPMQWDNTTSAGFSTNEKTWLLVAPEYMRLNVESENRTGSTPTHLTVMRDLLRIRRTPAFLSGQMRSHIVSEDIYSFIRQSTEQTYLVILDLRKNMAAGEHKYDFTTATWKNKVGHVVTASANLFPQDGAEPVDGSLASYGKTNGIDLTSVPLYPGSAVVLRVTNA